ncbi:MAG: hypothetical protein M3462_09185 [Chloroflexota bacterium]|nr:hypothetical protein [Chloroflexota bacterium]
MNPRERTTVRGNSSPVEQDFARDCDANERVRFFVKLPKTFTVDTPIGTYNPGWAIAVTDDPERLYLVSETKGTVDKDALRGSEERKIACAIAHLRALGVGYGVATTLTEVLRHARAATGA